MNVSRRWVVGSLGGLLMAWLLVSGCSRPHETADATAPLVYDFADRLPYGEVLSGWTTLAPGRPEAATYLNDGWDAEPDGTSDTGGRWAVARRASLRFVSAGGQDATLTVEGRPYTRFHWPQSMRVIVNGQGVGRVKLKPTDRDASYSFSLPEDVVAQGENDLEFRFAYHSRRKARSFRFSKLSLTGAVDGIEPTPLVKRGESGWGQPPATIVQWPMIVPRRAVLRLQPTLASTGQVGRVTMRSQGRRTLLREFTVSADAQVDISLADLGGERVTLAFENAGDSEIVWTSRVHGHVESRDANVYLITIDTLRGDAVGYAGYPRDVSPTLDGLAQQGVAFLSAFAQSNESAPSHASILTGRYPQSHGITWNGRELHAQQMPLATILNRAGFDTAAYVNFSILSWGTMTGHDFKKRMAILDTPPRLDLTQTRKNVFAGALNWTRAVWESRHFLWLHSQFLHMEDVPTDYVRAAWADLAHAGFADQFDAIHQAMVKQGFRSVSREYTQGKRDLTPAELVYWRATYDGGIRYTDDHLAAFLDGLRALGVDPFAAIIVVSDHGMSLGEDHRLSHIGPPHEHLLHVPLVFLLPGVTPGHHRVNEMVETIDIAPTLLAYLGISIPRRMQGQNLLPLIRGDEEAAGRDEVYAMVGRNRGGSYYAIRDHDWFYWTNLRGREFFGAHGADHDLESVLAGQTNAMAALRHRLLSWMKATPDVSGGGSGELTPELRQLLEKAGYLEERD
ncbi:MAG: sulfatase [Verrucomicrobia bacterium]|nr:sulfatase [Verrucomicrobiota bacterium]